MTDGGDETTLSDLIADLVTTAHCRLPRSHRPLVRPNGVQEWTPLAGVVLSRRPASPSAPDQSRPQSREGADFELHLIGLGAGSKVLPTERKSLCGDVVNDLHAEVLAVRSARVWLMDEMVREMAQSGEGWLEKGSSSSSDDENEQRGGGGRGRGGGGKGRGGGGGERWRWRLAEGVQVHLYVSTLPCGDASTVHLAKLQETLDPAMAALKAASSGESTLSMERALELGTMGMARGREGYLDLGTCRTKPGRADSPPTTSLSCSDKIAAWTVLGLQGALLSTVIDPIPLSSLVLGEIRGSVDDAGGEAWEGVVKGEVERAVCSRPRRDLAQAEAEDLDIPPAPSVHLTSRPFIYSRHHLAQHGCPAPVATVTSIAFTPPLPAVRLGQTGSSFTHPVKRSSSSFSSPHEPLPEKSRTRVCKLEMMRALLELHQRMGLPSWPGGTTYRQLKTSSGAADYQARKQWLRGEGAVFRAWRPSDERYEAFDGEGRWTGERGGGAESQVELDRTGL